MDAGLRQHRPVTLDRARRSSLWPLLLAVTSSACAHLAPPSFAEVELDDREIAPVVVEVLEARGHRVAEVEAARVATGWEHEREDAETTRERFVVTWEGEPPGPVTFFVRHEAETMKFDGSTNGWSSPTHDLAAQQRLLDAITDRWVPPPPPAPEPAPGATPAAE